MVLFVFRPDILGNVQEAFTLGFMLIMNVIFGLMSSNVDNAAHLGGFVIGLGAGLCFPKHYTQRANPRLPTILGGAYVAGMFLLFSLILWLQDRH